MKFTNINTATPTPEKSDRSLSEDDQVTEQEDEFDMTDSEKSSQKKAVNG